MKGDFTRDTFSPESHYEQVLMQQGRVQVDADWNEQGAIAVRRDETIVADLVGDCGGPAEGAAFGITSDAAKPFDFLLSPGRYYVDGLQCELEREVLFTEQPDRRGVAPPTAGQFVIYLDVWQRHVTVHEDAEIREVALGGPDTGTRLKTVWQVRAAALDAAFNPADPPDDPCHLASMEFNERQRQVLPRLAAQSLDATPDSDPCLIPASAGYRGLENQLYRVEIHTGGNTGVATYKWSRENGSVVTRILANADVPSGGGNVNRLTVVGAGLDEHLGFSDNDIVEIIHDNEELEQSPGKLARIASVAGSEITLKAFGTDTLPITIDVASNPRLRRWEGFEVVASTGFADLESGIQIRFEQPAGADFRTGDYWQIPARTASPDAQSGRIEWPSTGGTADFLEPKGITHHFCRVGVVSVDAAGAVTPITDCRCLWPALTAVPRIFYVSGDGQEVMPDLTGPDSALFKLPRPLIVGVANRHCLEVNPLVRFEVVNTPESPSVGQVVAAGGVPAPALADVPLDAEGLAKADFHLDGVHATQQARAQLLNAAGTPVSLPVIFNANLSIASQVAYQPGNCAALAGEKTVQDAIDRLARMASIYKVSGDGQQGAAGGKLKDPLTVRVASRCGPLAEMNVTFKVILGGGQVAPVATSTDANGEASCAWELGDDTTLQVVQAEVIGDAARPVTEPRLAHFIAHLAGEGSTDNDPAPVRVVGIQVGAPPRLLANDDANLTIADLRRGLFVLCNRLVDSATVNDPLDTNAEFVFRGQPTCFVTVEEPFPVLPREREEWDLPGLAGYRSVVLHGTVHAEPIDAQDPDEITPDDDKPRARIVWRLSDLAAHFLERMLFFRNQMKPRPVRILLRLTLKGNFIWATVAKRLFESGTPGGFLDGEALRAPKGSNPHELLLPSGDRRRGGDFEMWFWLVEGEV